MNLFLLCLLKEKLPEWSGSLLWQGHSLFLNNRLGQRHMSCEGLHSYKNYKNIYFLYRRESSCLHAELFCFFFFFCTGASSFCFPGIIFLFLFAILTLLVVQKSLSILAIDDFSSSVSEKNEGIIHTDLYV